MHPLLATTAFGFRCTALFMSFRVRGGQLAALCGAFRSVWYRADSDKGPSRLN